jgi:hypothetical protein
MQGNGCGFAWVPQWIKDLLFNWFFEASCNKHDIGYKKGGDSSRRAFCDLKFFKAMQSDSLRYKGLKYVVCVVQAHIYYIAVRAFGWLSFNYKKDEV